VLSKLLCKLKPDNYVCCYGGLWLAENDSFDILVKGIDCGIDTCAGAFKRIEPKAVCRESFPQYPL
jgi:hypothetical protein